MIPVDSHQQTTTLVTGGGRVPIFEAGQRIDDFDLLTSLGKGAFATVFLARQCSMQRMVALKISRDRGSEPQTLAQLDHPNIVRVFDQRQLAEQKLRLLYMQYIAGGTLQEVVEYARKIGPGRLSGATLIAAIDERWCGQGEQPPGDSLTRYRLQDASWPQVVCWLGARLAGALAYAHERGVLHRDVKPANVLVAADGQPKLADFNISFSKLDGATPAAYFGGSLAYMSPEQLEACDPAHPRQPEDLDGRSDVYSLGVLLWELLTLRRPFTETGLPESWSLALAKMTGVRRAGVASDALALVPADCTRAVSECLLKCLAPDTADRHASAAALARELELCLQPRAHALLHTRRAWSRGAQAAPGQFHDPAGTLAQHCAQRAQRGVQLERDRRPAEHGRATGLFQFSDRGHQLHRLHAGVGLCVLHARQSVLGAFAAGPRREDRATANEHHGPPLSDPGVGHGHDHCHLVGGIRLCVSALDSFWRGHDQRAYGPALHALRGIELVVRHDLGHAELLRGDILRRAVLLSLAARRGRRMPAK